MAHFSAKPVNTVFHLLIRFGRPGSVSECWGRLLERWDEAHAEFLIDFSAEYAARAE